MVYKIKIIGMITAWRCAPSSEQKCITKGPTDFESLLL